MKAKQLLKLGFTNTSYTDDEANSFTEFQLKTKKFTIAISGIGLVEINFNSTEWHTVPNCQNIQNLKNLIKLFS